MPIRFMPTTARKAAASDDDAKKAEETATTPESPSASVPEDLDYYSGLLGQQPGADKAATKGKDESASSNDYPIPLPSYLLLAMATVLSIAFTGSIFEVTGGHPEVRGAAHNRKRFAGLGGCDRRVPFLAPVRVCRRTDFRVESMTTREGR